MLALVKGKRIVWLLKLNKKEKKEKMVQSYCLLFSFRIDECSIKPCDLAITGSNYNRINATCEHKSVLINLLNDAIRMN